MFCGLVCRLFSGFTVSVEMVNIWDTSTHSVKWRVWESRKENLILIGVNGDDWCVPRKLLVYFSAYTFVKL